MSLALATRGRLCPRSSLSMATRGRVCLAAGLPPIVLKLLAEVAQLSTFALVSITETIVNVATAYAKASVFESELEADADTSSLRATAKIMTVEAKVDPLQTVARVSEGGAASDVALEQTTAKVDESDLEADAKTSYIRAKVEDC